MKQFSTLLKLNFKTIILSTGGGANSSQRKGKAVSGLFMLVALSALMLFIGGTYSFMLGLILEPVGALDLMFVVMAILAAFMCFVFTAFSSQGVLFSGKDIDIIFSLPITSFSVMLSKVSAVYLENLLFTVFIMAPAGIIYLYFTQISVSMIAMLVLCTILLPFFPSLFAVLFSFLTSFISAKMRRKNLFIALFSIIGFVFIMIGSLQLNTFLNYLATDPNKFRNLISKYAPPIDWMRIAIIDGSISSLLLFAAFSLIPFLVVCYFLSKGYQTILTKVLSQNVRFDYKMGTVQSSSPFNALLKKEMRRFFGTPIYLMNSGIGIIMILGVGVAALLYKGTIADLMAILPIEFYSLIAPALTSIILFLVIMCPITAPSISLEGKQLWILQEAPISTKTIFKTKIALQLYLTFPALIAGIVMFKFAFSISILDTVSMLLPSLSFCLLFALIGLTLNLLFPRLDVPNDTIAVKQSMSAIVTILGGMFLVALITFAYYKLFLSTPFLYPSIGLSVLFLLASAALWAFLSTKGTKLFAELH